MSHQEELDRLRIEADRLGYRLVQKSDHILNAIQLELLKSIFGRDRKPKLEVGSKP